MKLKAPWRFRNLIALALALSSVLILSSFSPTRADDPKTPTAEQIYEQTLTALNTTAGAATIKAGTTATIKLANGSRWRGVTKSDGTVEVQRLGAGGRAVGSGFYRWDGDHLRVAQWTPRPMAPGDAVTAVGTKLRAAVMGRR